MQVQHVSRYRSLRASLIALVVLIGMTFILDVMVLWFAGYRVASSTASRNSAVSSISPVPLVLDLTQERWTTVFIHGIMLAVAGGALLELRLLRRDLKAKGHAL